MISANSRLSEWSEDEVGYDEEPSSTPQPQAVMSRGRKRVLIVDDDGWVRGALAAVLFSEGYLVEEAADGQEAVAQTRESAPDLVLLDLNMPRLDGWTALSRLDKLLPLVPVIVITARPNQYEEAVRLGVDAFMEKPLGIRTLLGAVRRLVNEPSEKRLKRITNRRFVTQFLKEGHDERRG